MSAGDKCGAREPVTPDPVREDPPADRFCDLILNGGVASGVVYPWALIELARHYRFRSIGGNSVGAMAAAVAAAGEYGRCIGVEDAFEPLRRFPLDLAEGPPDDKTKMFRLFQPSPKVRRLFNLFIDGVHANNPKHDNPPDTANPESPEPALGFWGFLHRLFQEYRIYLPLVLLMELTIAAVINTQGWYWSLTAALLGTAGAVFFVLVIIAFRFYRDLEALAKNDYGLCTGKGQGNGEEGLVEWLHRGVQLARPAAR